MIPTGMPRPSPIVRRNWPPLPSPAPVLHLPSPQTRLCRSMQHTMNLHVITAACTRCAGWGLYPTDISTCPVFKAVFAAARRFYALFQVHTTAARAQQDSYVSQITFRKFPKCTHTRVTYNQVGVGLICNTPTCRPTAQAVCITQAQRPCRHWA